MLLALLTACGGLPAHLDELPTGRLVIDTRDGPVSFQVWIAETPEAQVQGLRGVEELPEGQGMVFLHPEGTRSRFTMEDTLIPLSLAVWGENGRIATVLEMVPCERSPCPTYDPLIEWVGALEVDRAALAREGVSIGDPVRLER